MMLTFIRTSTAFTVALLLSACGGGNDTNTSGAAPRLVIAVDVAVPETIGGWSADSSDSSLCTFDDREAVTFTTVGDVLVERFGSASIDSAPLGSHSGRIVNGACTNLIALEVSTSGPATVLAFDAAGEAIGTLETTPLTLAYDGLVSGRRSPNSPWTLGG